MSTNGFDDANQRLDEYSSILEGIPEPHEILTDRNPLEPSEHEALEMAERELAAEESPEKRSTRTMLELHARLSSDAMAVPTSEQLEEIQRRFGIDFTVYDPEAFAEADFRIDYLVDRVLVETQPCVIAGPSKSLKTSISIDLAISLASGTAFLNTYRVNTPKRVLFLSAESGLGVIRCIASRVANSRRVSVREVPVFWGGWVPRVKVVEQLAVLRGRISEVKPDVVFIDPVYQSVDGTDAANVSLMGQQLGDICRQIQHFGATPILVHHTTKTSQRVIARQQLEIHDLAGAGVTEFFRQWILVNPREPFAPDRPHRLWLSAGGSAGHAVASALDIDEMRDEDGPHGWSVELQSAHEAREESATAVTERKEAERQAKRAKDCSNFYEVFRAEGSKGLTKSRARDKAGINTQRAEVALAQLLADGKIEECNVERGNRKYEGYRVTKEQPNQDSQAPQDEPQNSEQEGTRSDHSDKSDKSDSLF